MKILPHCMAAVLGLVAVWSDAFGEDLTYTLQPTPDAASSGLQTNHDWTGFYIGADGGYGWSNFDPLLIPSGNAATSDFNPLSMAHKANGTLFGGHVGYNWQNENLVFGVEGDFSGAGIGGSREKLFTSKLNPGGAVDGAMTTDTINWLSSVRGRLGYTRGAGLLYFTGGVAFEGISRETTVNAETARHVFGVSTNHSVTNTNTGFVLGTGYERMIARNWTLRGEYLFYDFNQTNTASAPFSLSSPPGSSAIFKNHGNDVHALRVGLSYKF